MAAQDSPSYLSKLAPWSRSPTVQPSKGKDGEPGPLLRQAEGADHAITHTHRAAFRKYPRDCPPLRPMWFHAVDSPKRRPNPAGKSDKEEKPFPAPKKYAPFSKRDSKAIETAYRKLAEKEQTLDKDQVATSNSVASDLDGKRDERSPAEVKVPVNEDYLFDVDIEQRELAPAYWLGPVYEVRRGSWFYQEGSVQRPCEENLAEQLEDGYLKVKAWKLPPAQPSSKTRSNSQPRRPTSWATNLAAEDSQKPVASAPITPKGSNPDLRKQAAEPAQPPLKPGDVQPCLDDGLQNTYRLFGSYMNSIVTYQNEDTAWLLSDDFLSRMNFNMYERFAGGGHLGGTKLIRGYADPSSSKKAEKNDATAVDGKSSGKSAHETNQDNTSNAVDQSAEAESPSESRIKRLERQMSSLLGSEDQEKVEEEIRKRDEKEIEEDYQRQDGEDQGREIEHLILVTHGIGQRLGLRIEAINFVHDINTFRKTIKAVYAESPDLKALNSELDKAESVNCRIQVLPICWRHRLEFPKKALKSNRKEQDLGDTEANVEEYPNLEDISIDGVPAVRNLITDLALDILLYQAPAYKDHISRIVLEECNRIYHLFMDRNPKFAGKVSLIGHSLGSAVMFDLLCNQDQQKPRLMPQGYSKDNQLRFDFEVEDFYALGSPIGLFQMLQGRTIVARQTVDSRKQAFSTSMDDPMLDSAAAPRKQDRAKSDASSRDISVSSPKVGQLFNLFHPTDPISYRIEPLISPSMSSLKPQPLPYTKRGIFGAPMGQGLTGIGARVTQSVSSMWSSMASNLLTRGLGYQGDGQGDAQQPSKSSAPLSLGQKAQNVAPGAITQARLPEADVEIAKVGDAASTTNATDRNEQRPPILLDTELETLYSGFEKRRKSAEGDSESRDLGSGPLGGGAEVFEAEERAKHLKREEEKVRKLNSNGRVDYAIQEGVFDINLIAAIASHLSYWSDEDVSHFIISQLLSRGRLLRPSAQIRPDARM